MSRDSICFDVGGWARFVDLDGREQNGEIVSGGVVGHDGQRSDVCIAVAGKNYVVPPGSVLNNTFDHLDELNEMVAAAQEQAQQEEEAEEAYAKQAAEQAAADAAEEEASAEQKAGESESSDSELPAEAH